MISTCNQTPEIRDVWRWSREASGEWATSNPWMWIEVMIVMTTVLLMISDGQGAGYHDEEGDERDGLSV